MLGLAGVLIEERKLPRCLSDLMIMGTQLWRSGSKLLVRRDLRVVMLMSMQQGSRDSGHLEFRGNVGGTEGYEEAPGVPGLHLSGCSCQKKLQEK